MSTHTHPHSHTHSHSHVAGMSADVAEMTSEVAEMCADVAEMTSEVAEMSADVAEMSAASASVTLDIGAGRGALVIYPPERLRGHEIEISRPGSDDRLTHTGVHERRSHAGSVLTAIFGSIPPGDYLLWPDPEGSGVPVTVCEAAVTEITLD